MIIRRLSALNRPFVLFIYYRNGVLHGKFVYDRKIKYDKTFGKATQTDNQNYTFDIYKGFITGTFDFRPYSNEFYTGSATNGIINNMSYDVGKYGAGTIRSNSSNPSRLSVAESVGNQYGTRQVISIVQIPVIDKAILKLPEIKFPVAGK